jgi:TolB-like protein
MTSRSKHVLTLAAFAALLTAGGCAPKRHYAAGTGLLPPLDRVVKELCSAKERVPGRKIAVYEFTDISGKARPEGRLAAERLTTKLARTGEFRVIERSRLEAGLKELQLAASGVMDEETALRAGKLLGAEATVTGTLVRINRKFELNVRMVDVETGSIIAGSMVLLDEADLEVKAEARERDFSRPQPPKPAPAAKKAPAGWEAWPGWEGRYGDFRLENGRLYYDMTSRQHDHIDAGIPEGYYPGLLLAKRVKGEKWTVEAKVNYHMPTAPGRWFSMCVWVGPGGARPSIGSKAKSLAFCALRRADSGYATDDFSFICSPGDRPAVELPKDLAYLRFERDGGVFKAWASRDGIDYEEVMSVTAPKAAAAEVQKIVLGGQSYLAAGSYAEYEYIKLDGKPLF